MSDISSTMIANKNLSGGNYFHEACEAGSIELLRRVLSFLQGNHHHTLHVYNGRGSQPIHVTVRTQTGKCAAKIIEQLIKMGADINGKERVTDDTALHMAVYRNDYILAEWLCDQDNIAIDALDWAQKTPYQVAWARGDRLMMGILKDHGASTEPPADSKRNDDPSRTSK